MIGCRIRWRALRQLRIGSNDGGRSCSSCSRRTCTGGCQPNRRTLTPSSTCGYPSQPSQPVFLGLRWEKDEWPWRRVVERGYGLASAVYTDIRPDADDGRPRSPDEWGAIGQWAMALSRSLDRLVDEPRVDASKVVVIGHSRLGKVALWAAAQDERFAMAVSNNSGCGGAALSRRDVGESVEEITSRFPHWFCPGFASYAGREDALPVDQHELLALIAPRPVVVGSAAEDTWADPEGERLGAELAAPVFRLLGADPPAYCLRDGGHALRDDDWERYLDLADRLLADPAP